MYVCDTGGRCLRLALKYSTSDEKQMFAAKLLDGQLLLSPSLESE